MMYGVGNPSNDRKIDEMIEAIHQAKKRLIKKYGVKRLREEGFKV